MFQTVMAHVSTISTTHSNPSQANRQMQEVIEANQKLSSRVTQKDLIRELMGDFNPKIRKISSYFKLFCVLQLGTEVSCTLLTLSS